MHGFQFVLGKLVAVLHCGAFLAGLLTRQEQQLAMAKANHVAVSQRAPLHRNAVDEGSVVAIQVN